jgi:RNA polymerase sigma-70 factor, ECF subfamily
VEVSLSADEYALLAGVAKGDAACFERLYPLYERRVFQYLMTLVHDAGLAEELVVDTLLAVWNGAARFSKGSRISTWIFGIARHKALDALRHAGRERRSGRHVALEEAAEIPPQACGPEELTHQISLKGVVGSAFKDLSAEHREILHLAFFEDLPYEEIASLLSLPVNTVKTRVYYAKQKLKAEIERHTMVEPAP